MKQTQVLNIKLKLKPKYLSFKGNNKTIQELWKLIKFKPNIKMLSRQQWTNKPMTMLCFPSTVHTPPQNFLPIFDKNGQRG